jgi:pimeloyl-ACP methyl ester carboxylesterase
VKDQAMFGRVLPRSRFKRFALILALLVVGILIVAGIFFYRAITPPTPGDFYALPDPLPAGQPGDIIRSEQIASHVPEGAVAWRILYLSTDAQGNPNAVSGVVIAPEGASPEPRPVIAWAHGTQGIRSECGTSHRRNAFEHISALGLMIEQGFVVVATDYPGRGTPGIHPYLIGQIEARSVLDSVRAARQLGVQAGESFAIWGASQGGHATLWAAHLAPSYAQDLDLVAAAAQAAATDLPKIFDALEDEPIGGALMSQALYAWGNLFPDADLDTIIDPDLRDTFETLARTCLTTPLAFLTLDVIPPSTFLSADPREMEPWKSILEENIATGAIDVPLLITHGTADPVIPYELSIDEAARRCSEGQDVTFVRFPGVSHPGSDETGVMTVGWIEDRFAGRPTGSTCGSN